MKRLNEGAKPPISYPWGIIPGIALFFTCVLSFTATAETYQLIKDHYLDIGNRWEYEIHVTEDFDLGDVDWWGTQVEQVTASQMIEGYSTKLVETTETITNPAIETSWINDNYQMTPHSLLNIRSETEYDVFIVKNNIPYKEAPIWVSDSDDGRSVGGGYYGKPDDPNDLWVGYRETWVTYLRTETVTVPAGTFDCINVMLQIDIFEPDGVLGYEELTAWVDPNIGIIQADEYIWWSIDGEIFESQERRELTWSSYLPSRATGPDPTNDAVNQSLDVNLSWTGSPSAISYNVYFGECGNMEFKGNQSGITFDPEMLSSCTTYCWRIDAVNTNGTIAGNEWSFTTGSVVPDIVDLTEAEAEAALNSVSLTKGTVSFEYSSAAFPDLVVTQTPLPGSSPACNSSVDMVISLGPWPDINGDTLIDLYDLWILSDWWMRKDCNDLNFWCEGADYYKTGAVDLIDFDVLSNGWLTNPGLVAFWTMDDNSPSTVVKDISGYGNDGQSSVNTDTLSVAGIIGSALSFNGTDDYIEIPNSESLNIYGDGAQLTICGWFKFDRLDKAHALVWKTEGSKRQFFLNVNTSKELIFRVFKSDSTDSKAVYQLDNSLIDNWVFVAGIFDGQRSRLYLDGSKVGSTGDVVSKIRSTTGNVVIGNPDGLTGPNFFNGEMDNIMIFDRAISEEEILTLSQP